MKSFNTVQETIDYSTSNPLETVESKSYYRNGQLSKHYFYVNGKLHGEYKDYHSNGQLWEHCFYVNGLYHGELKSYHSNGNLKYHYFYVNDEVFDVDYLNDGSYKSLCIKHTLFDGNLCNEDI